MASVTPVEEHWLEEEIVQDVLIFKMLVWLIFIIQFTTSNNNNIFGYLTMHLKHFLLMV